MDKYRKVDLKDIPENQQQLFTDFYNSLYDKIDDLILETNKIWFDILGIKLVTKGAVQAITSHKAAGDNLIKDMELMK